MPSLPPILAVKRHANIKQYDWVGASFPIILWIAHGQTQPGSGRLQSYLSKISILNHRHYQFFME